VGEESTQAVSALRVAYGASVIELALKRRWLSPMFTTGELSIDGVFECFIGEDVYRGGLPKVAGASAIPVGRYEVVWAWSPKFQRYTLRLAGVPGFDGILIHGGNTSGDTEGCLLTGSTRGVNRVDGSQMALKALEAKVVPRIHDERCFINITVEPAPE
jgi:Steigviridae/Suoliviridae L,D-carboxypeptidase/transpeptidase